MKVLLFPISLIFEFFQARTACLVLVSTLMALPSAQGAMSASGGIVSDGVTSLQWDQCPLGLSTVTTPCDTGSAQTYIWTDALSQVVSLNASNGGAGYKGHNDWRLPNINELESLVKFDGYVSGAYIDATFPNTPVNGDSAGMGGGTWTSTTYAWNNQTSKAWAIGFGYGETKVGQKTADSLYVRLVRGGQTYAAYDSLALTAQTITFNNPGAQTFGTTPTLSASATSGLSVSFTSSTTGVCTITSGGALSFVSVGQCTINADQAGNGSFAAAPQVSRTFTVNQASQTITGFAPASPVVFGASPATLSASGGASGSPIVFATTSANTICTVTGNTVTFTGVGICNLTANQAAGGSYSAAPQVTASVTINAAGQAITGFAPASPVVFGASPATLSASGGASSSPIVFATTSANTICTVTGNTVTFTGVGICNLTANQAAGGSYSAAPQVTASVTINAAGQAITGFAPASPVVFGASPATLSASGGASGSPIVFATTSANTICTVTGNTVTFTGVGICNLTANQAAGGSYSAAPQVTASVTINAAGQAITGFAPASPVVFGASPATLSASGGASGSPIVFATTSANTICTVTGNTVTFTGVGICNLTANQAAGGSYSAAPQVTASVTINAAGQAITGFAPASPVVFGASPATLSASGGASGSPIVFATTSANTICTVTGNTVTFTGVGICNLTANQAAGGSYSAAPQVTASVTINAAGQAITGFAPASPVVFGASPATLSASGGASSSPIVFATTSANTICTVTGNTVTFTGVGICNLTANQAAGGSYSAAPQVTASVTINAAGQAITGFAPASPVVFGASPATLSASGGASSSPIVFATTSANTICTVTGNTVTFTGVGICNLTANQAAGGSYSAAPQVTASVTINAPITSFTGPSPSGGGNITASFTGGTGGCGYATAALASAQTTPAGVALSHGVFSFTTTNCGTGSTLNFTITYPGDLPAHTKYYKYGPEFGGSQEPHWYELPGAVVNGNQVTFSITDNGVGDGNLSNGVISDPGGPGAPPVIPASIPTLSEWGLILMASMLGMIGLGQVRRRR